MSDLHPEPVGWRDRDFIDFPTAWWINDGLTEHLDPRCSAVQTAAFLCDCGAIQAEWERRRAAPKEVATMGEG